MFALQTWTLLNGSRLSNTNGEICNGLSRKKESRVFPQIKSNSRSKSSNNLFELISNDKPSHSYANSGFLTERRGSHQFQPGRQSINTPQSTRKQRSISVESRPFTAYASNSANILSTTSSQKSVQSFNGSYKDKHGHLALQTNDATQRPISRDSFVGFNRPQTSDNITPLLRNSSNKSLAEMNWTHNIRDEANSPIPLNIAINSPINTLIQTERTNALLLKHRSSSVQSPSSNDSLSGASFKIKCAGRRRLSLPTTHGPLLAPITFHNDLGKSPEYTKAFQDLHGSSKAKSL